MGEEVKQVISALVHSEHALSMSQFVEKTNLPVEQVALALDFLVATRIFQVDNSYVHSEVGEMVYMFAGNENAQTLFNTFHAGGES